MLIRFGLVFVVALAAFALADPVAVASARSESGVLGFDGWWEKCVVGPSCSELQPNAVICNDPCPVNQVCITCPNPNTYDSCTLNFWHTYCVAGPIAFSCNNGSQVPKQGRCIISGDGCICYEQPGSDPPTCVNSTQICTSG